MSTDVSLRQPRMQMVGHRPKRQLHSLWPNEEMLQLFFKECPKSKRSTTSRTFGDAILPVTFRTCLTYSTKESVPEVRRVLAGV
ncbi:unnamed protein product [Acanthoscelides obtectus]|uniref:Uncharacterized protein n=1 Tax=Acanthoscelides obtectus TaxID=200917 RepID=A0A9P0NXL6_ACAOB|nr:unnamed protein product [Acanthoscelides obtectus]CAK1640759.1 hypothetical protein AOBTE_LOCUS11915 [Acanthoscelides obtectus]